MRLLLACVCCCVLSYVPRATADDKPREIKIALKAEADGKLSEVIFNGTTLTPSADGKQTSIQALHEQVVDVYFDSNGVRRPGKVETYVEIDGGLVYEDVRTAIEAIREHRKSPDAEPESLVDPFRLVVLEENEGRTTLDLQLLQYVAGVGAVGPAVEEPIVLQMKRDGNVRYGGSDFVTPDIVRSRLRVKKTFLQNSGHVVKETTVAVWADARCTMSQIGKVLFAARSQGFQVFDFRNPFRLD